MNFAEYFGHNLDAAPEPEQFETFEAWCWRLIHEERVALERLVQESIRESAAARDAPPISAQPEIPLPDNMARNSSIETAWRLFHSAPRALRERSARIVYRPRPSRPRPGSEDPSTWPEDLL